MATYNPNTTNYGTNINPVTGQATPGVVFNAPDAQNPYGSYTQSQNGGQPGGSAPVSPFNPTNTGATMSSSTLANPQAPVQFPPTQPQQYGQAFVNSLGVPPQLAGAGAGVGAQEKSLTAAQRRIMQLSGALGGQAGEQARLEGELGVTGFQKNVTDLTNKLNQQKAAFDAQANQIAAQAGTQEGLIGSVARLRREEAVSVGITAAALEAAQGNLTQAKDTVDRALKVEFDPIRQELENTKLFLDLNYKNLDRADKLRADALQRQNQKDMLALNAFYDIKKSAISDAIKNNPGLAQQYASAKSLDDFANINASAFSAATNTSEKVQALKGTMDLLQSISDSSGLNTRVGPTGFARRFLGIADSFGAGQAFAGSVHQLVSQQTLNTLINLKQAGGTLGALSDGERRVLENAASKINDWEKKNKQGAGEGVWNISEKEFKKELGRIQELTRLAIERAGGSTTLTNQDYQEIQGLMQAPAQFNAASYY